MCKNTSNYGDLLNIFKSHLSVLNLRDCGIEFHFQGPKQCFTQTNFNPRL